MATQQTGKARVPILVLLAAVAAAGLPTGAQGQQDLSMFGYLASRYEKVFSEPDFAAGGIVKTTAPGEFSYPSFNLMFQQDVGRRFKVYANLSGADANTIDVSNMWGEVTFHRMFTVRFGKTYRKFGLYNEILDAVPTYYGIEPPEMFDKDHLLLSRTTTLMVHGNTDLGPGTLSYALTNDNGEGDVFADATPVGFDVNYMFGYGAYKVGVSGYRSGGPANSDVSVGDGSPSTGVLPWMTTDDFSALDTYAQAELGALTLQAEYARAHHMAERDADAVVAVVSGTDLNDAQLARFLVDPAGGATTANVATAVDFVVQTWYVRAGYSIWTERGEFAPYVQWDWYSNPETIATKSLGGDAEAGIADDGAFDKATLGVVYRPVPTVAIKLDGSQHRYGFHGSDVTYPEIRLDISYTFGF